MTKMQKSGKSISIAGPAIVTQRGKRNTYTHRQLRQYLFLSLPFLGASRRLYRPLCEFPRAAFVWWLTRRQLPLFVINNYKSNFISNLNRLFKKMAFYFPLPSSVINI